MPESSSTPPRYEQLTRLRQAIHRRDLAGARHRSAVARRLALGETEMRVVAYLAQRGSMTPTEIGEVIDLSSGGVSALVARLQAAGHVTREAHPADGRSSLIRLSSALVERAAEAYEPLVRELQDLASAVDPATLAAITIFLTRVAEATESEAERAAAPLTPGSERHTPVPALWG